MPHISLLQSSITQSIRTRQARVKFLLRCVLSCILIITINLGVGAFFTAANAHSPHHIVTQIKLSRTYAKDNTLLILVRDTLLKSEDDGQNWSRPFIGLDNRTDPKVLASSKHSDLVLMGTKGDGIYRSEDFGSVWEQANQGLETLESQSSFPRIYGVEISPNKNETALAYDANGSIYRSENRAKGWDKILELQDSHGTSMTFGYGGSDAWLGDNLGRIYRSKDDGQTWVKQESFQTDSSITAIESFIDHRDQSMVLIGTADGLLFCSDDSGETFKAVKFDPRNELIEPIADIDVLSVNEEKTSLIVLTEENVPYYSKDSGLTWKKYGRGLTTDKQSAIYEEPSLYEIAVPHNYNQSGRIFLGGFDGLFYSDDRGLTWHPKVTLSSRYLNALAISPNPGLFHSFGYQIG